MNQATILWIVGVTAIPLLAWGVRMTWLINSTHRKTKKLVDMHEEPDRFGFGTIKSNKLLEENTRAVKQLTHYMIWMATKQAGEAPPPFIEDA